jgi:hypothetical protein
MFFYGGVNQVAPVVQKIGVFFGGAAVFNYFALTGYFHISKVVNKGLAPLGVYFNGPVFVHGIYQQPVGRNGRIDAGHLHLLPAQIKFIANNVKVIYVIAHHGAAAAAGGIAGYKPHYIGVSGVKPFAHFPDVAVIQLNAGYGANGFCFRKNLRYRAGKRVYVKIESGPYFALGVQLGRFYLAAVESPAEFALLVINAPLGLYINAVLVFVNVFQALQFAYIGFG